MKARRTNVLEDLTDGATTGDGVAYGVLPHRLPDAEAARAAVTAA